MAFSRFSVMNRYLYSQASVTPLNYCALRHNCSTSCVTQKTNTNGRAPISASSLSAANLNHSTVPIADNFKTPSPSQISTFKPTTLSQPQTLSSLILQSGIVQSSSAEICSGLADSEKEYKCPSRLNDNFAQLVILDNVTAIKSFYDCPEVSSVVDSKKAPDQKKSEILEGPGPAAPVKEAKIIMKIRHKKMKKHKLKKLRKRMYFVWRKQKLARRAKRMAIFYKHLEDIKKTGEDFDAEVFVREQLAKARKGGYERKVFESNVQL